MPKAKITAIIAGMVILHLVCVSGLFLGIVGVLKQITGNTYIIYGFPAALAAFILLMILDDNKTVTKALKEWEGQEAG